MEANLVILKGSSRGREVPLPSTVFVIGRGQQCHLRVTCPFVSRQHCALANWGGKVVLTDLKSAKARF